MNKNYSFIFMTVLLIQFSLFATNDFLIKPKNNKQIKSKRRLKENIGLGLKDSLNLFSDLTKTIAKIQSKIATIQKQSFSKVEDLIDNKKPFKKATRGNLNSSLNILQEMNLSLQKQLENIRKIKIDLDKDLCLKK